MRRSVFELGSHRSARNLDLDAVGNTQLDDLVGHSDHFSVQPAGGHDLVTVAQLGQHLLHLLAAPALGGKQQEVEDKSHEDEWKQLHPG